jgi:signal peptidase I
MLPPGQRMWIDRTAYWWRAPARGDVVVLPCPTHPTELCVKRVVGLPGERVQIINGQFLINRQPKSFAMIDQLGPKPGLHIGTSPEYQLANDELFLLGDNAATSQDSRTWEPPGVSQKKLLGRVLGTRRGFGP